MSYTITPQSVKSLLNAEASVGESVRVQGWLRSKRDSKAGISFLAIHDGSCFDTIQAVVPADLDNYESEVKKLSTGCSVDVVGKLVQSEGKGQSLEIQASRVEVVGTVDDPEGYPIAKKRHTSSTCVRRRICARAPIPLVRSPVSAQRWPTPYINFSLITVFTGSIRRS